jgi:hypothetical protein
MLMNDAEQYELQAYFENKVRNSIIKSIKNFEFPDDWTPKQVIDYITYKIDRK